MFRSSPVRAFEQLETRSLLSGCSLATGAAAAISHSHVDLASLLSARFSGISSIQGTFLSATLSDPNDASVTGTAKFASITHNGATTTTFTAGIQGAAADTPYDVEIDGTSVGTITTDGNGNGRLSLTGSLPVTVAAGDTVSVGTATGTLAAPSSNVTHLSASLSDSTGASAATGNVHFVSYTDEDGNVETKLAVSVKGADASTTFDVDIDGTMVGELTTDANGDGKVVLTGGLSATPVAGSTVTIVNTTTGATTISGTLAVSTGNGGGFGFGRRGFGFGRGGF